MNIMAADPKTSPETPISTPEVTESQSFKIIAIIFLIIIALLSLSKYMGGKNERNNNLGNVNSLSTPQNNIAKPPQPVSKKSRTSYLLKKDIPVRIMIDLGDSLKLFGGGHQYYARPQNSKPVLIGGRSCNNVDLGHVAYVDLMYYDQEIEVIAEKSK